MSISSQSSGFRAVNRVFLLDFPSEAARVIDGMTKTEAIEALINQQADAVLAVISYLSPARADEVLASLKDDTLREVLINLEPVICAAMMRRKSETESSRFFDLMPDDTAAEIKRLMEYPTNSAGRVMDSRFATFRAEQDVDTVLQQLRKDKPKGVRQLMIVDAERKLQSVVDIQELAIAEPSAKLSSIAKPPSATVSPFDPREDVANKLKEKSLEVLPVIDVVGRLIGVIRHDALMHTLREETSADIQTMVGVGKDERALSSPWLAVRKRLPWMEINLATAFLAAAVVGLFENTIANFTALAVLLPVVAGQSGNAGAQALAVTMRGLALREITVRHWLRVMMKEASVGMLNGIAIALTTALGVFIWSRSAGLSFVIGVSMIISMIAAGIAGAVIPVALTRLGQDPAQSSSIILTTVTDVAGFMSFLGIATLLASIL